MLPRLLASVVTFGPMSGGVPAREPQMAAYGSTVALAFGGKAHLAPAGRRDQARVPPARLLFQWLYSLKCPQKSDERTFVLGREAQSNSWPGTARFSTW